MEATTKWTRITTNSQKPVPPSEVATATRVDWLARLRLAFARLSGIAFGPRRRYRAAEGATDAELARLTRGGVTIDDARWQYVQILYGGGHHV